MVSEPRYSIKNLETFYMGRREGEVKDADASIVYYERWKETGDSELLDQIQDYNEDDCISTQLLREWLLTMRPTDTPWFVVVTEDESEEKKIDNIHETEARLVAYRELLLGPLPLDKTHWDRKLLRMTVAYSSIPLGVCTRMCAVLSPMPSMKDACSQRPTIGINVSCSVQMLTQNCVRQASAFSERNMMVVHREAARRQKSSGIFI